MNLVIEKLFKEKGFIKGESQKDISFFYRDNSPEREFFFVQTVDASGKDGTQLREELEKLEYEFSQDDLNGLRNSFLNQLSDENKIQFDKNLSLIILVKIDSFDNLSTYKNHVYAVEESPRFFKKNVLIYTKKQLEELCKCISASHKSIEEVLNEAVNSMEGYLEVYKNENYDGLYSLVVRMFSKIPFLIYFFSKPISSLSLENSIMARLEDSNLLILYNEIIKKIEDGNEWEEISKLVFTKLSDSYFVSEDSVQRELVKLIGGSNGFKI